MSDIKLFKLTSGKAAELKGEASHLEKPLQTLIEDNLEPLLGIRFIATEHSTGKVHGGRIDSLGLDENSVPVILEYKRSTSENVINQGLFYLDWLLDHKAEFQLLVQAKLGAAVAEEIDWSAPRLICVATDFTKYDDHAVQQIDRNIDLIRYRKYGSELLLLDLVNSVSATSYGNNKNAPNPIRASKVNGDKTLSQRLDEMNPDIRSLLSSLENFLYSLGDDVQRKDLKLYIAFKRLRNFTCVVIQNGKLMLNVAISPETVDLVEGFTRDMRNVGHWGTGDLEITLGSHEDLERAKPLLQRAYAGG